MSEYLYFRSMEQPINVSVRRVNIDQFGRPLLGPLSWLAAVQEVVLNMFSSKTAADPVDLNVESVFENPHLQ